MAQWIARWTSNSEVVGSSPISGDVEKLIIFSELLVILLEIIEEFIIKIQNFIIQ